jgi:hypothetical protein
MKIINQIINRLFLKELISVILISLFLLIWYVTAPDQTFPECKAVGVDVPTYCGD